MDIKQGTFIFWKHKDNCSKSYSESYVQSVIDTDGGILLELTDSTWWTKYPIRVLAKDIDILTKKQ